MGREFPNRAMTLGSLGLQLHALEQSLSQKHTKIPVSLLEKGSEKIKQGMSISRKRVVSEAACVWQNNSMHVTIGG